MGNSKVPKSIEGSHIASETGPGWYPLIRALESLLDEICPGWMPAQVKEKFGVLRFYIDMPDSYREKHGVGQYDNPAYMAIRAAEIASGHICEICGDPGKLQQGEGIRSLVWKTRCSKC